MLICLVMRSDEHLLSADDVARLCGLSRKAVYRAIERGELKAFRLCSRLRIEPGALDAWLEGNVVRQSGRAASPWIPPARLPETTGLRRFL
jgi:excisionase family DNA binding protein